MIIMDAFQVYKYYLALKLHFTTDKYDVIKQKGKVRASRQAFAKRSDLFSINKIAKKFSDEEVANFLIANFVSGDRWGGLFDSEAKDRYLEWKKRIEGLTYNFEKDLNNIQADLELNNLDESKILESSKNTHPYIIKAYLRKVITIETLVIIDKLFKVFDKFDNEVNDDILYPDISRLVKKYDPFLKVDLEKFNGIYRKRFSV